MKEKFSDFIFSLQDKICRDLEIADSKKKFREDKWSRKGGGGGITRVIEKGNIFEKGGVNVSTVFGELPEPVKKHFKVEHGWFWAGGISLVIHPESPMVPTMHANFRYFELYEDESMDHSSDAWFGGGADLTPFYLFDEDATHFHKTLKKVCDKFNSRLYPLFKKECDQYFYNSHRDEGRGIGGLFFDYLRDGDLGMSIENWYHFVTDCGMSLTESYIPVVERRKDISWNEEQRYWQEIRRGRYVEFNLIHDRGTLFGLKTEGRIESIFMSLPPRVRWDYDFTVGNNSVEARLLEVLKKPKEWA
ncbi:MAG: oxygen-dependent coproporphyrinogen oxidase [Balneolaceae bacterium]